MADAMSMPESTRVFVSGLPPTLTNDQLASHFRTQYKVTDVHVMPERRIGFVGFHDPETAQNAVKYFNRTYIRMSRIAVDLAKPIAVKHNESGQAVPVSERVDAGRKGGRSFRGQQSEATAETPPSAPEGSNLNKRKRDTQDDGEDERTVPEIRPPTVETPVSLETPDHDVNPPADDDDWLRGRTSRLLDLIADEEAPRTQQTSNHALEPQEEEMLEDDDIHRNNSMEDAKVTSSQVQSVPNARLFIRNLAFDVTADDLTTRFGEYGKINEAHIVKDNRKSTSKGMAYVQFSENESAERALQNMDGVAFHGRLLHVLPASDKREQKLTEFDLSKMPLKKQKAIRRKMESSTATFSWNSLYMNPDAVISSIAQRLGVAKSDILDPTSADAAVKQAHAETQVIAETKEYFRTHGVSLDALKSNKRDDRALLLKNFHFGTTEEELKNVLEPFGEITRFMLPPAGTMAIVQFAEPYFASQAMKNLAYKNIKGAVLYLEKAPEGIFTGQHNSEVPSVQSAQVEISAKEDTDTPSGTTSTLFVRNLNFSTTSARLTEVFRPLNGFLSARVKTRVDPKKRPGEILSMGFGFVEFSSAAQANAALASMNNYRLDGHNLLVKISTKSTDVAEEQRKEDNTKKSNANRTKILIKNIPFQTTRKDIRTLFAQYGQLKTVRVPKKFDNTSRGFGFAEFVTAKEAKNAVEALSNTHLLGRKLVLEFAQEETIDPEAEINALERKMDQQSQRFNISKLTGGGRKKFNVEGGQDDT